MEIPNRIGILKEKIIMENKIEFAVASITTNKVFSKVFLQKRKQKPIA